MYAQQKASNAIAQEKRRAETLQSQVVVGVHVPLILLKGALQQIIELRSALASTQQLRARAEKVCSSFEPVRA